MAACTCASPRKTGPHPYRSITRARCRTSSSQGSRWWPMAGWARTGCSTRAPCWRSARRVFRRSPTRSEPMIVSYLGAGALLAGLVLAAFSALLSFWAGWTGNGVIIRVGRRAFYATAVMIFIAAVILETALLTHDFSLAYVTEHSDLSTPVDLVAA